MRREPLRSTPALSLSVVVLNAARDAVIAGELSSYLREAEIDVVDLATPGIDTVCVLLSSALLADVGCMKAIIALHDVRLVPLRLEALDDTLVPDLLRDINWIDVRQGAHDLAFHPVIAALTSDPEKYHLSRQLALEAEAWRRGGEDDSLLIDHYGRAKQMLSLLSDLIADPMARPSETTRRYILLSARSTRRLRRKQLLRRSAGILVTFSAIAAVIAAVPIIDLRGHNNKEAIVTAGVPETLNGMPEWSAVNSAALILSGTKEQQVLGRITLRAAVMLPWRISDANMIVDTASMAPYSHGTRAVVLFRLSRSSAVALFDIQRGRIQRVIRLTGVYDNAVMLPDERQALIVGEAGGVLVDLASGAQRDLDVPNGLLSATALSNHEALVFARDGNTLRLSLVDGSLSKPTRFFEILDARALANNRSTLLVKDKNGDVRIVRAASGQTLATRKAPNRDIGGLSPDGNRALVAGADQLWEFGVSQPVRPTGIAVPTGMNGIAWPLPNLGVVLSDERKGEVFYLPRALFVGTICRDAVRLEKLTFDATSDVVACLGAGNTFWHMPAVPTSTRPAGLVSAGGSEAGVTATATGKSFEITRKGRHLATGTPFNTKITAIAVAENGTRVLIGSQAGAVAVVEVRAKVASYTSRWQTPDGSSILALGWSDTGPVATTASGLTWAIPTCLGCDSDAGLLAELARKLTGCLTVRQLSFIDDPTRRRVGATVCQGRIGGL